VVSYSELDNESSGSIKHEKVAAQLSDNQLLNKNSSRTQFRCSKCCLCEKWPPKFMKLATLSTLRRLFWQIHTRVYPKVSGLAAWSENSKWCSCLPLGAVVSLFCESV
jgi:hypothetical protein